LILALGVGTRLEYLLVPLVFGLGAPLVALVGTNIGAGSCERALRVARTGAAIGFAISEAIGLWAAGFPRTWLSLFSDDPGMIVAGSAYLRAVGPFYGVFRSGAGVVLQLPGRRPLAVAAICRSVAACDRRRRGMADAAMDGRAPRARAGAGLLWSGQRRGGQIRRMVHRGEEDASQRRDSKALVAGKVMVCGANLPATARMPFSIPVITTRRPVLQAR
jgi:MatE